MTTPTSILDPELRELEIKVKQRLNDATIGAMVMICFIIVVACGLAFTIIVLPLL